MVWLNKKAKPFFLYGDVVMFFSVYESTPTNVIPDFSLISSWNQIK
jgi:hypothetical protein